MSSTEKTSTKHPAPAGEQERDVSEIKGELIEAMRERLKAEEEIHFLMIELLSRIIQEK